MLSNIKINYGQFEKIMHDSLNENAEKKIMCNLKTQKSKGKQKNIT